MRVAFDVDGVVLRSIDLILDHVNKMTGLGLSPDNLFSWDLEPLGLDLRTLHKAVEHMYSQRHIEAYEGAVAVLSRIHHLTGEPLLFITGRSRPETALRQLEALPWNPTVPEMIVTGGTRDKRQYLNETAADFIIEDDMEYAREYLEAGLGVGLMLQPWNRGTTIPVTRKFKGWAEIEKWFLDLRSEK